MPMILLLLLKRSLNDKWMSNLKVFNWFYLFYIILIGLCIQTNLIIQRTLDTSKSLISGDALGNGLIVSFLIGFWSLFCIVYSLFAIVKYLDTRKRLILMRLILIVLTILVIVGGALLQANMDK